jgi:hypothetical protein
MEQNFKDAKTTSKIAKNCIVSYPFCFLGGLCVAILSDLAKGESIES